MPIRECLCPPALLLALAAERPGEFPILLDSATQGPLGRWSILAAFPAATLRADHPGSFLQALELRLAGGAAVGPSAGAVPATGLPFTGGWFVYLGYEIAAEVEPTLRLPASPDPLVACALRVPAALLWDAVAGRGYAVAEDAALLAALEAAVQAAGPPAGPMARSCTRVPAVALQEDPPEAFMRAVDDAQWYIRAGDIYQANLSRQWRAAWPGPAAAADAGTLYRALRRANPAPFAAWARLPGLEILSSSPERLVRVRGRAVETRPIAGTRPRRADGDGAAELAALLASAKERAEHTMLIDLERNDLGRVCVGGSVHVPEFMITESYAHVHHIVSGVRGRLRADAGPVDVLRAVFPGGTITGCPKVRCMQLIAGLEGQGRGAYTGSLGYINHDGSMDFNILIRTLTLAGGELRFRAGAGIVADSVGELELAETRAKALGLVRAVAGDAA